MRIEGKHKQTFEIEYELEEIESRYFDNKAKTEILCKIDRKKIRAYCKGIKLTDKYLKKMKRLGFNYVEQNNETAES